MTPTFFAYLSNMTKVYLGSYMIIGTLSIAWLFFMLKKMLDKQISKQVEKWTSEAKIPKPLRGLIGVKINW